jgi:hypothetical protein
MGADDGERADRADPHVRQVHRAALAAAQPVGLAQDLAERPVERRAHGQHRAVTPVRAGHRVAAAERARRADHDGLLPVAQVGRAAHEALREQAVALALELPDLVHGAKPFEAVVERGHAPDDITLFATLFRI